jgi:PAS domain S-box-containing protein
MLGYTRADLLAGGFQQITHPDDLGADLANVAALLAGHAETYSMEKRYIARDGTAVRVNLTVGIVLTPEGTPDHFVAVVRPLPSRSLEEEVEL